MMRVFLPTFLVMTVLISGCGERTEHHEEDEHHDEVGVVHLSIESQKLVNLEIVSAQKETLQSSIEVVGEIAQETENVSHVTSPEGGILKAYVVGNGDVVEKGAKLCLVEIKTGEVIEILSLHHGIVLAQYTKEGDSVDTLTSIMTIADPDVLRASFNVYEKDLSGVKVGQDVTVRSIAYPDKQFDGKIVFVSPRVDSSTRTIKIRVDVQNEEHLLKFGMFVTGEILVPLAEEAVTIPQFALQQVEGQTIVFVPKPGEEDEFEVREVQISGSSGSSLEGKVAIKRGLEEGENVVGKGSFYLKSELLKGELAEGHAH